jgi:hypothetical protein
MRPLLVEDPVRVLVSKHFVVLHQIDTVGLQPLQRFVELARRLRFDRPSILVIRKTFSR